MPPRQATVDGKESIVRYVESLHVTGPGDLCDKVPYGFKQMFEDASCRSWILVGNGCIPDNLGKQIDRYDVVIRCNRWRDYGNASGTKCDVLFLNGRSRKFVLDSREHNCLNIVYERRRRDINFDESLRDDKTCFLQKAIVRKFYSLPDATTGFRAMLLLLKLTRRLVIVGFQT